MVCLGLLFAVAGRAQDPNFDADKFLQDRIKARKGQEINATNAQQIYNEDFERALQEMMRGRKAGTKGNSADEEALRKEIENAPRLLQEEQKHPLELADDMLVDGSDLVSITGFFLRDVRAGTGDPPDRDPSVFGTAVHGEYTFATGAFRVSQVVSNQQIAFVPLAWGGEVRNIYGAEKQKERMRVLAGAAVDRLMAFSAGGDVFIPYSQFFPAQQERLRPYIKGVFRSKGWRGWHYDFKNEQKVIDGTGTYWDTEWELCYRFQTFPTVTSVSPFGLTLPKERDFCLEGTALDQVTSIVLGGTPLSITSRSSTKICVSIPSSFQGGMVLDEKAIPNSGSEMLRKAIVPLKVMAGSTEAMFMGFTPPFKGLMVFRDPDASADAAAPPDLPAKQQLHRVSGRLFYDKDRNGKFDAGETGAPFGGLKVTLSVLQTTYEVQMDKNTGVYQPGDPLEKRWEKVEEGVTTGDGAYSLTKAVHGKQFKITIEIPPNHISTSGSGGFFKQDVVSTATFGPFEVDQDLTGIDFGILQVPRVLGLQFEDGTTSTKLTEGNLGQTMEKGFQERRAGNVVKVLAKLDIPWPEKVTIGVSCVKFQQWPQSSPSYWSQEIDDFSLDSPWLFIRPGDVAGTNQFFTLADDIYEADEPVWITIVPELCSAPLVFPQENSKEALKLVIVNDDLDMVWTNAGVLTPPNGIRAPGTYFMGPPYPWRLPDGKLGQPYRVEFLPVGPMNGTPRWNLLHGAGLAGLEFDTRTGILSGTPESLGDFGGEFMFSVSLDGNNDQHTEKWFFLKIEGANAPAPSKRQPPRFIPQPSSVTFSVGDKGSLRVDAIGSEPLSYQWQKQIEISGEAPEASKWETVSNRSGVWGAQTSILRFDSIEPGHAGSYRLVVKNSGGEVVSPPVRLALIPSQLTPSNPLTPSPLIPQNLKSDSSGTPVRRPTTETASGASPPSLAGRTSQVPRSGQPANAAPTQVSPQTAPEVSGTEKAMPPRSVPVRPLTNRPSASGGQGLSKSSELPGNPTPEELVWIPPGKYLMGSPNTESGRFKDEGPQHEVQFQQGFWMGKAEVTQRAYEAIMNANPSSFRNEVEAPVETVSYAEAQTYCRKLTERDGLAKHLPQGFAYRLPTEAEWEYACRAGSQTAFTYGEDSSGQFLDQAAWFKKNTGGADAGSPRPVGRKATNAWGLFDMHGNVAEWCFDVFAPYPPGSPTGQNSTSPDGERVVRGGSWADEASLCRSAARKALGASERSPYVGFRVVLAGGQ